MTICMNEYANDDRMKWMMEYMNEFKKYGDFFSWEIT